MPKPITLESRFGTQPIHGVLRERSISFRAFARDIGLNVHHVYKSILGHTTPSPEMRERSSKALGLAVEDLFTVAAREAQYLPQFSGYTKNRSLVR